MPSGEFLREKKTRVTIVKKKKIRTTATPRRLPVCARASAAILQKYTHALIANYARVVLAKPVDDFFLTGEKKSTFFW